MWQFYGIVDFRSWQRVSKVLNEKKVFFKERKSDKNCL